LRRRQGFAGAPNFKKGQVDMRMRAMRIGMDGRKATQTRDVIVRGTEVPIARR
jgi:hypothetical protein